MGSIFVMQFEELGRWIIRYFVLVAYIDTLHMYT